MARPTKTSGKFLGSLTCELKLPGLNDYIDACRRNRYAANTMKHQAQSDLACFLRRMPEITKPVWIRFTWTEKDRRRDPDNVAFGKKFILDAMVRMGKLKNDNQTWILGFEDRFQRGPEYKVEMEIYEETDAGPAAASEVEADRGDPSRGKKDREQRRR